jgi:paraquat-inducible protein B
MVFDQSVRGLAVGAPVDFLGIDVGAVRSLAPTYDAEHKRYPVEVTAQIYPLRLGAVRQAMLRDKVSDPSANMLFLKMLVDNGLRAQLRAGNLLTGTQYVALDFAPDSKRAKLDTSGPVPQLPTVRGPLSDLQPQIASIVAKINKVPFDEIGRDLQASLHEAQTAIRQLSPEAQKALAEVEHTLGAVRESLARLDSNVLDEDAPMQRSVQQTMTDLQRAAQSLRDLSDYLQRHPEAILRGKRADAPVKALEGAK